MSKGIWGVRLLEKVIFIICSANRESDTRESVISVNLAEVGRERNATSPNQPVVCVSRFALAVHIRKGKAKRKPPVLYCRKLRSDAERDGTWSYGTEA